jgi:uncharacterized protein YbjQ (UPF0145 family)
MKRFFAIFAVAFVAVILTGCGVSSYMTSNVNVNQTNVVLQEDNFHVVRNVSAEVSQSYFFGIGGISKRALKENAVHELTEKAHLTGSQALINVTMKEDLQTVLVWCKRTVRAQGTVVEFDE